MYMREKRVLLRHYLEHGVAKAELASGQVDRDLDEEPVRYRPRPPVPTKLDPYRGIITARLETFPALTAQRLFDEVRAAGYPGGYTQVKAYVRQVRPRPPVAPVVRFETPPGYQGQVDFGTFALPWGRRHALLIVLGYSRLLWLQFFPRQTMAVLIRGLEAAFTSFGGVPQELLFDQMRSVVTADGRPDAGRARDECRVLALCVGGHVKVKKCGRGRTCGRTRRAHTCLQNRPEGGFAQAPTAHHLLVDQKPRRTQRPNRRDDTRPDFFTFT